MPADLEINTVTLHQLFDRRSFNMLDIEADGIQRREVHTDEQQAFLIDSIARGLPIGAITIYIPPTDGPDEVWEIIDGKQRLTAIFGYMGNEFIPRADLIKRQEDKIEEQLPPPPRSELAIAIRDKKFNELTPNEILKIREYKVPVYMVRGPRSEAVRIFSRMNHNTYSLEPQELRNALFRGNPILIASMDIADHFNNIGAEGEISELVKMKIVSEKKFTRMYDVQFASELLYMAVEGGCMNR